MNTENELKIKGFKFLDNLSCLKVVDASYAITSLARHLSIMPDEAKEIMIEWLISKGSEETGNTFIQD